MIGLLARAGLGLMGRGHALSPQQWNLPRHQERVVFRGPSKELNCSQRLRSVRLLNGAIPPAASRTHSENPQGLSECDPLPNRLCSSLPVLKKLDPKTAHNHTLASAKQSFSVIRGTTGRECG